jgi:hypothetical protein
MRNRSIYVIICLFACFKMMAQPANNNCASASALTVATASTTASATTQTLDPVPLCACTINHTVWFTYTTGASGGSLTLNLTHGTIRYAGIALYSGTCGTSFTELGCNQPGTSTGNPSLTVNCLAASTTYYVMVYDDNSCAAGTGGTYTLTPTFTATGGSSSNDDCTGATNLGTAFTSTTVTGNNTCASADNNVACTSATQNIWYKFTTGASAGYTASFTVTPGTMTYPAVALLSGSCGSLTSVACNDPDLAAATTATISATCLSPNTTYYVEVDQNWLNGTQGTFTLSANITATGGVGSNDNCTGATNLGTAFTNTTVTSNNNCATADNNVACTSATQNVWYKFTTGASAGYTASFTVTPGTMTYPAVALLSGSCGTLTSVACNDPDLTATTTATISATCLSPNTTYYVEVDQNWLNGTQGTFTLSANVTASTGPPANDNCSGAVGLGTVSTTTTVAGTNICGSADLLNPTCFTYNKNVWYSFTVPAGGASYSITVTGGTLTYPNVAVASFTTACSASGMTQVSCDYSSVSGSVTSLANCLAAGTYYIMVDSDPFSGSPGTFSLTLTETSAGGPPSNDNCSSAISLGTVNTTTTVAGTNACAGSDLGSPGCFTYNQNVWYSFTVPAGGGDYLFTLTGGTNSQPVMAVWQFATVCSSTGATNPACNSNSTLATTIYASACLSAGTYYVMVDNGFSGLAGTFSLTVTKSSTGAPSNNTCGSATSLGSITSTTVVTGDNTCATADVGSPSCFTYNKNVWYSFTVPAGGGIYLFTVSSISMQYPTLAVWSFATTCTSAGATYPVCNSNSSGSANITSSACLNAGTYYVMVDNSTSGEAGTFSLTVTQSSSGTTPTNNDCGGATTIVVGNCVNGNVVCATQSQVGCLGTANDDVWYKFVATASTVDINVSASSSFDPVVQVFSGACAATVTGSILCDDADFTTGGSNQCKALAGLTVGNTYYIRVYDYGAGVPATTTFTMCLTSTSSYTCNLNYSYTTITPNIESGVTNSITGLVDDYLSNVVPIGFTFCYDGFQYNALYVSSNAALVFDAVDPCVPNVNQTRVPAGSSIYTGWSIAGPAPTTTDYTPQNAILGPWHDIDPARGGTITYGTLGTSPSRRFVVYFNAVKQFELSSPCQNTSYDYTGQLKLYETSNIIEIHVQQMTSCTSWNNGQAILGLHNPYGTIAVVPTGYNANAASPYNQYSITNKAWQFSTPCTACLTILPLEVTEFTAAKKGDYTNEIKWTTANENLATWFYVERSVDGKKFETATKVKPLYHTGGTYSFIDNLSEKNQTMYYRVGTEDQNGSLTYSGLRMVQRESNNTVSVLNAYPNPFSETIHVDIESLGNTAVKIEIFDILGKIVFSSSRSLVDGTNSFTLDDIDSKSGLLFFKVTDVAGNILFTKKIMKE